MASVIPIASQKRLLRLVSARTDVRFASDAFQRYASISEEEIQYHFFTSMVLAYCRPFTENFGIGSLLCEYPSYPDYQDEEMNIRHNRMWDLRNTILGHSSVQGTRVWLLAPGAKSPVNGQMASGYGYAVAKLTFHKLEYVVWLHDVVDALTQRLDTDIRTVAAEVGAAYLKGGEKCELDTGKLPFQWSQK